MSLHGSFVTEVTTIISQDKAISSNELVHPLSFGDEKAHSPPSSTHPSPRLTPSIIIGLTPVSGSPAQSTCQDEGEETSPPASTFNIPIVGYEIMEERARFTVYKLRVENRLTGDCWYVFRRYTDFVRLLCKLKNDFPDVKLSLPKKRWFRDNFDSRFLESRIQGLQAFVNNVLLSNHLCASIAVKDFFCLNEPPSYTESMEESRVIFEVLEETVFNLRCQVQERDLQIEQLKKEQETLFNFIRMTTKECPRCFKDFVNMEALTPPFGPASIPASGSNVSSTLTSATITTSTSAAPTTPVSAITSMLVSSTHSTPFLPANSTPVSTISVTPISTPKFSSTLTITSTPIMTSIPMSATSSTLSDTTSTPVSATPTPVSATLAFPVSATSSTPVSANPSTPVPSSPTSAATSSRAPSSPTSAAPSTPALFTPIPSSSTTVAPITPAPSSTTSAVPSTPGSTALSIPISAAPSIPITAASPTPISVAPSTSILTAISVPVTAPTFPPTIPASNNEVVQETEGSIMSTQPVSSTEEIR